jgi:hypothetical protein
MLVSEKIAMAAHLHVLLRRKTGRVTDTEWMATNAEYAAEIIRFARTKAVEDGHTDLAEWADKLERATREIAPARSQPLIATIQAAHAPAISADTVPAALPHAERDTGFFQSVFGESGFADTGSGAGSSRSARDPNAPRYVGGIR